MNSIPKRVIHINFLPGALLLDARPIWTALNLATTSGKVPTLSKTLEQELGSIALQHVVPTVITVNKQKKTVKLRSKLDLSTEEEKIANKAAISAVPLPDKDCQAPIAPLRRSCAVASVSWRGRSYRVPSRTKQFRNR